MQRFLKLYCRILFGMGYSLYLVFNRLWCWVALSFNSSYKIGDLTLNNNQMLKRLLIPGLAVGTLSISATSATAASFILDSFDFTNNGNSQFVRSTRSAPSPPPNTQTGLTDVLGGSRKLQIDSTSLIPPSNPLIRTTIQVTPSNGELSISNASGVNSQTTSRYDAGGVGLNNTLDGQGNSLGNWLTGRYAIDYFALNVTSLDTTIAISLRLGFGNGKVGSVTRNVVIQGSNIVVQNNPTLPGVLADFYGSSVALFSLTEFLGQSGITLQDFQSVSFAELKFTGATAFDGSVDLLEGVEIPEPSLTLSLFALSTLGVASTLKRKLKPSQS